MSSEREPDRDALAKKKKMALFWLPRLRARERRGIARLP